MSKMEFQFPAAGVVNRATTTPAWSAGFAKLFFLFLFAGAVITGFAVTGASAAATAASNAGEDLTRLLRAMAALKAAIVLPAAAAIVWRLGSPIGGWMFAAYAGSAISMALSIGLIWHMAHVGAGAFLMHAGLIGTLVLLFRDKTVGERLGEVLKSRSAR